jgi:NADH dehydrogenase
LSVSLGKFAQKKLAERGVDFVLKARLIGTKADVAGGERAKAEHGKKTKEVSLIPTETFVWTAGNKSHPVLQTLGLPLNRRGQIKVNTKLAVPDVPGLWAAGDCAEVPSLTNYGKPAPPTAQHAQREGKVLGYNVAATIKGQPLQ